MNISPAHSAAQSHTKRLFRFIKRLFWDDSPAALAEAARRVEDRRRRGLANHSCSRATF